MGFTPQQIGQMSMWQFFAALNGYIEANSPKESNKLSEEEADELFDWISRAPANDQPKSTPVYVLDGLRLRAAGLVNF